MLATSVLTSVCACIEKNTMPNQLDFLLFSSTLYSILPFSFLFDG